METESKINKEKVNIEEKFEKCLICWEIFEKYKKIKMTKCYHKFHIKCIEDWCVQKHNCPFCRTELEMDDFMEYDY